MKGNPVLYTHLYNGVLKEKYLFQSERNKKVSRVRLSLIVLGWDRLVPEMNLGRYLQ